jgi:hypothetical protein
MSSNGMRVPIGKCFQYQFNLLARVYSILEKILPWMKACVVTMALAVPSTSNPKAFKKAGSSVTTKVSSSIRRSIGRVS